MSKVDLEGEHRGNKPGNRRISNARDAAAWEATDKRQEIAIEGVSHLYLVVQPSGSKSWAWRARPLGGGAMVKATLPGSHSYAQAIGWAEDRNRARAEGRDERAEQREGERLKAAAEKVEAERLARSVGWYWSTLYVPRYVAGTANAREVTRWWRKHIEPAIGGKALTDIDHDDLAPIVSAIHTTAPVTANRVATWLRTFFRRGVTDFRSETRMRTNPAEFIVKPHRHERRNRKQRALDRRELGYLLSMIEATEKGIGYHAVYARVLRLMITTGVRISEAVEAPWSEFDLEAGIWTVASRKGNKNKLPHLIPLSPLLLGRLKEWRRETNSEWVFSVDGSAPLHGISKPQAHIYKLTRNLAERDGEKMELWSSHALRRTFSTHLNGLRRDDDLSPLVHPAVIEATLNHQSGSKAGVAGDYNKWEYAAEKKAALRVWERHLTEVRAEEKARDRDHWARQEAEAA